jgi:hypothetical protein
VARYLAAAAREVLLDEHIRKVCAEKGTGAVPSRTWEQVTACARLAARLGSDLGLDPIGHARLKAIAGHAELTQASLADLAERGAEIRARRMAEFAEQDRLAELERGEDDEVEEP